MNFSEQPPSTQWAALKYRGEKFAEVWFKPQGEPFTLTFRIPQGSFQIHGMSELLTIENLLKAVGITEEEVESWGHEGASVSDMTRSHSELRHALPPPQQDATHLNLRICLKPPTETVATNGSDKQEIPEAKWQYLEERWNAIRVMEAGLDSLRISMDGLRTEMESTSKAALPLEVKLHALSADLAQWNKAKSRIHYAVPKVREFIHRATWATASAERKKLDELYESHIRTRIAFPQIDQVVHQFDSLLKDRQVLSANGMSVNQECRTILGNIQSSLRTLERNSASNGSKKKGSTAMRVKPI